MNTWLLIDCHYLCHRAWHTTGGLAFNGEATGVSYGLLRDLETFISRFVPSRVVLAFDYGGGGLRAQIDPQYKANRLRDDYTEDEERDRAAFLKQVNELRSKHLPDMGFNNVFFFRGYEADDIIAKAAKKVPAGDVAIIITADEDLWQCLDSNVQWYNPTKNLMLTQELFKEEWKIDPVMWSSVKALAGCSSDNVKGIAGIGNKSAAAWFAGTLKPGTKKYDAINANLDVHNKNIELVRLPFPGLELPEIRPDDLTDAKIAEVKDRLGIRVSRSRPERRGFKL